MIPTNFTRNDLNIVANRALAIVGSDKRWCDAINRAVLNLATGRFSYDGHVVMLHSSSSEGVYRIDVAEPMTCTCKGRARGYRCWHIVAARLIVRAAEYRAEMEAAATAVARAYAPRPRATPDRDPNWPTEAQARANPAPRRSYAELTAAADAVFS